MKKRVNPPMIVLGRESRGYTQKDMAEKLRISQGKMSKIENGFLIPSDEEIMKLSRILDYPIHFFLKPNRTYSPNVMFYRKYQSLAKKEQNRISALIETQRIHLQELLESTELINNTIMHLDTDEYGSPQEIAQIVRTHLGLPRGPIQNLTEVVEKIRFPVARSQM